ncbi:hypothetical protein [Parahaliea mediterranea]|uniref:Uncharacterized protein n=1 Tax=Parahaliea mediterranea TaxID=651086 RepID=A0A939IIE0_9GAMM|nr:hypothetical protein [Parahaliea mediterranea]MBN7796514.1 hypothetical protein [Parahaliea mediterranea]
MHKRTKLWSSLSLAALVGAGAIGAHAQHGADAAAPAQAAMPAGGEGGEGEGEGLPRDVNPATNDVAYLTQLGLMRGHLLVGLELYRAGHIEHARTHMKHPRSELYADLVPAFEARGSSGFGGQLGALTRAVESDDSTPEAVEAAYTDVLAGISAAEAAVGGASAALQIQVAVNLLRTAAEEYGIGVVDGKVVNGHEYQDAYGFTRTARARIEGIDPGEDAELAAGLNTIEGYIQELFDAGAWPSVMPPETLEANASLLFGAAARVEIVGLGLR